ncbi:hypothetical protein HNY73_017330 [Argiope bruennichi]|uniref:DUF5641 domain-containing protein n=1 Tax=Argiope bruennichi TaxID=94029 RepID=A0A8T0ELP4_ARGBR|nr:hypothetical protein HNY73_017330 [Argiope bruennichi]
MPSPAALVNISNSGRRNFDCLLCDKRHPSQARKLTLEERRKILSRKGACFSCLRLKHVSLNCKFKGADVAGLAMTGNSVQLSSSIIVSETSVGRTLIVMSIIRLAVWVLRFIDNVRGKRSERKIGELSLQEEDAAERVEDLVFLGDDYRRLLNWPFAKVLELLPTKDSKVRTVKLKTENGIFLRPIQRIYHLELSSNDSSFQVQRLVSTRGTSVEKAADASLDHHVVSDVTRHRDEIPCDSGVPVDPYSVSDSPILVCNIHLHFLMILHLLEVIAS